MTHRRAALLTLILIVVATHDAVAQTDRLRLPAQDRILSVEFRTLYAVGRADGGVVETFSDVPAVAFDDAAQLYVLDRGNSRVVVFDSAGRHVRTIGRRGAGPGEFTAPSGLAIAGGNVLAVGDPALRTITLFGPDGVLLRTVPVGDVRVLYPSMQPALDGGLLMQEPPLARAQPDRHVIYHHGLGADETAIPRYHTARNDIGVQVAREGNAFRRTLPPVFQPTVRFAVWSTGTIAVAAGANYGIAITGAALGFNSIERPIRPRAVSEADREAARARVRNRAQTAVALPGGFTAGGVAGDPADLRFTDVMPVIAGLGVDSDGVLWIMRTGSTAFGPGPTDLVRRDGSYIGTIRSSERPAAFGPGGRVAFLRRDVFGVESVEVARVIMNAGSAR